MSDQLDKRRFLFLLCSSRRGGNSEQLARTAAAVLPRHVRQDWVDLNDHRLPLFRDLRHDGPEPWKPVPQGDERKLLEATIAATDLVMVAPVYWYAIPHLGKLYLDHWSAWLRVPELDFRERMAGRSLCAVSALSAEDKSQAGPLEGTLKLTADYMRMHWRGHLVGTGNDRGDVLRDHDAIEAARSFFGFPVPASEHCLCEAI